MPLSHEHDDPLGFKSLARQRTRERWDVAACLHSDMRRQPRTWTHHTTGSDDDRSTFELAVARQFMGRNVRPGTHACVVPQLDEVIIWAMQEGEDTAAWQCGYKRMRWLGHALRAPISTTFLSTNTRLPTRMPER